MATPSYQEVIQEWFTQFKDDEEQISLGIDYIDDNTLRLSCGDEIIVFSFGDSDKVSIAAEGDDKFVNVLVQRCKDAIEQMNLCISADGSSALYLKNVLIKFSEITKVMAANADDSEEDEYDTIATIKNIDVFDYQYENSKNEAPQVAGGVSSEWIEEYYMKKKWESKEVEIRAKKGETVDKATDLHPGANGIKTELFSSGASSKALTSDLLHIIHKSEELGYRVTPVEDDIYNWTVKLYRVRQDTNLAVDLIMLDDAFSYSYVEFQLNFAMDLYPFYPPLCTITRPRFEGFMLGKIATLPCLQLTNWDPLFGTADIIENIRRELEDNGRIDHQSTLNCLIKHPEGSYTLLEHLLLKLGTVTETTPRVQCTQEILDKNNGRSSGSKRKSRGDDSSGRYYQQDDVDESLSNPSIVSSSSSSKAETEVQTTVTSEPSAVSGFGKPISLPTVIPVEGKEKGWAKGTGYGHGQRLQQWDIAQHTIAQAEKDRLLNHLLSEVLIEMKKIIDGKSTDDPAYYNRLQDVVEKSCLIPLLEEHVKNESFLDMENHYALYHVVFQVLEVFADCLTLQPLLLHLEAQKTSLSDLIVRKLGLRLEIYNRSFRKSSAKPPSIVSNFFGLGRSAPPNDTGSCNSENTVNVNSSSKVGGKVSGLETLRSDAIFDADGLMPYIEVVVEKVLLASVKASSSYQCELSSSPINTHCSSMMGVFSEMEMQTSVDGRLKSENRVNSSSSSSSSSSKISSEEDLYMDAMRPLQYAESDLLSGYHYKSLLTSDNMGANLKKRIKRLGQEHSDLSQSLPLSLSSSVWLRASVERMDALQFMISGPEGTPYSNGLFLFDAYFPTEYPNAAPKVNLQTTGKGSVRFNPNLYNCGKVCLSLLGTWAGQKEESWDASTSTFLQVLVSIQSLILVQDPYFNEPGYEATMNKPEGKAQSRAYNEKLREKTIKWGMINALEHPTEGFQLVITNHFRLKKKRILEEISIWIDESSEARKSVLTTLHAELSTLLTKL